MIHAPCRAALASSGALVRGVLVALAMRRSAWRSASLLVIALGATAGCLDEYHPEFHPETTVSYVQNVSYPTIVVQPIAPAAHAPAASAAAAGPRAPMRPPRVAPSAGVVAVGGSPPSASPTGSAASSASASAAPPARPTSAFAGPPSPRPADTDIDAKLSTACLNDDAAACRTLAAMHLGQGAPRPTPAPPSGAPLDRGVRTLIRHSEWAALTDSRDGAHGELRAVF